MHRITYAYFILSCPPALPAPPLCHYLFYAAPHKCGCLPAWRLQSPAPLQSPLEPLAWPSALICLRLPGERAGRQLPCGAALPAMPCLSASSSQNMPLALYPLPFWIATISLTWRAAGGRQARNVEGRQRQANRGLAGRRGHRLSPLNVRSPLPVGIQHYT